MRGIIPIRLNDWFVAAHAFGQTLAGPILVPLVMVACVRGRHVREGRDWLHWLGVAVFALASAMLVLDGMHWFSRN